MKKRILVVDDKPAMTGLIRGVLEKTGRYEVCTENPGRKVIEVAREFRPDLILLDVIMPGMLGSEIASLLEADRELRAIKLIFLTSIVSKEEALRLNGQHSGHDFVALPISADGICKAVEDYLPHNHSHSTAALLAASSSRF